jgi:hypothetical protein
MRQQVLQAARLLERSAKSGDYVVPAFPFAEHPPAGQPLQPSTGRLEQHRRHDREQHGDPHR